MTISRDGDAFVIKAGNLIEKADVEQLREKLEQIRKADKDELKAMYKETLKGRDAGGQQGRRRRFHRNRTTLLAADQIRFHRRRFPFLLLRS